jgi:acyl-CoA thioester hydrolase
VIRWSIVGHVVHITVAAADIDELSHVNNAVYLRWIQQAAVEHSHAVGWSVEDFLARGAAFLVRSHEVEYLRPALPGDRVQVETRVVAMSVAGAERSTTVRRGVELLARAHTRWAFVDLKTGRPARIPAELRELFPVEAADAAATPGPIRRRSAQCPSP